MTLVVDASTVAAALLAGSPDGAWAAEVMLGQQLVAPDHLVVEVANVLRRRVLAGSVSADAATMMHADLLDLRVALFPYALVAQRCWPMRGNVTTYDAAYVALAEQLDAPLATLDRRLVAATGPRCAFVTPG